MVESALAPVALAGCVDESQIAWMPDSGNFQSRDLEEARFQPRQRLQLGRPSVLAFVSENAPGEARLKRCDEDVKS
jgi:hypothetical protein